MVVPSDAARRGLKPGDVIVKARGVDVRGARMTQIYPALEVPEGEKIELRLADGRRMSVKMGAPQE